MTWMRVKNRKVFFSAAMLVLSSVCGAAGWENLDDAHRVSGRRLSSAYLTGKVVLVSRDPGHAKRLQEVWSSFRGKPFIVLGTYGKTPEGVTFPVYTDADLVSGLAGQMFVVDALGEVVYNGAVVPDAIEASVTAMTDLAAPPDYAAWKRYFAFEAKELPGKALNRLADLKKDAKLRRIAFSNAEKKARMKTEKALRADPVYARLAKLEAFSAAAKDRPANSSRRRSRISRMQVRSEIKRYEDLKKHDNPVVAREARNCLADLAYVEAELQ